MCNTSIVAQVASLHGLINLFYSYSFIYSCSVAIMEPPLDKQGCNETACDEGESIGAAELPSWDPPCDWMSGRID